MIPTDPIDPTDPADAADPATPANPPDSADSGSAASPTPAPIPPAHRAPDRPPIRSGFLLVDKPTGLTSHGVVYRVRKEFGLKRGGGAARVGHLGTLDPNATGLLVMVVGTAGRALEFFSPLDKTYLATVRLGLSSDTDDVWGDVQPIEGREGFLVPDAANATGAAAAAAGGAPSEFPTRARIEALLAAEFAGERMQVPPQISAVQVGGKRAHRAARAGRPLRMEARPVVLRAWRVVGYTPPDIDLELTTSAGYYVRSLARDLGARLGTGGVIAALRRTAVGSWRIGEAHSLEHLAAEDILPFYAMLTARAPEELRSAPHGPQALCRLGADVCSRLICGLAVELDGEPPPPETRAVWALHRDCVVAILLPEAGRWRAKKSFLGIDEFRARFGGGTPGGEG